MILAGMVLVSNTGTVVYAADDGNSAVEMEQQMNMPASQAVEGDFEYEVLADGSGIKITDYTGSETVVTIPAEIAGQTVTSIGDSAFAYCSALTEITIPEGVTSIGNSAFSDCSALTKIDIPDGVTSIGKSVFYNCSALTEIIIPEGVTSIGDYAFAYCSALTEITIPEGVTSIGSRAFGYCIALREITIPESVTSIGDSAFYDCNNLTINCRKDSYAYTYADDWNYSFQVYNTITATAGEGGTVSPSGIVVVIEGDTQTFTVTADKGYYISDVKVDDVSIDGEKGSYTFEKVAKDHTIEAFFKAKTEQAFTGTASYAKTVGDAAFTLDAELSEGNGALTYESSNPAVASVDATGNVTVVGAGTATITVTAAETEIYNEASFEITITVAKKASNTGLSGGGSSSGSSSASSSSGQNNVVTTTETKPDGTKVETTLEIKTDGTKVETVTETKTDGTKTEAITETKTDGTKTETVTSTNADGTKEVAVTKTNTDGTVKETVTETAADSSTVKTTVVKDAAGAVVSTRATVKAFAAEDTETSAVKFKVTKALMEQISENTSGTNTTVTIVVLNDKGETAYKIVVNAADMKAGNKLYIAAKNSRTGEYTLINDREYTVSKNGSVNVSMSVKKKYVLLNKADMEKLTAEILETVTLEKTKAAIKAGKRTKAEVSDELNMANVKEITYTSTNKKVAVVSRKGSIRGKKAGKAVIKVKVTLKNGVTKTLKMTVTVK